MLALLRAGVGLLAGILMLLFHLVAVTLGCLVYVYFFPGVIAMKRRHASTDKLFVACALAGWTVVGWFVALAFALTLPEPSDQQGLAENP